MLQIKYESEVPTILHVIMSSLGEKEAKIILDLSKFHQSLKQANAGQKDVPRKT